MNAGCARLLGDADNVGLDFFLVAAHHEVCQLVDHYHDVGESELLGVAHAGFLHLPVSVIHLHGEPPQRLDRLVGLGDHRLQKVGDAVVRGEFHHLGVDHDEFDPIRIGSVEHGNQHRVDEAGLT
ncbi:hypothetical protein LV35_04259 [Acinetobacter baumannii]|uniref:Uncharacterized protein n=1 Tax=Acinetobacter baumannii TaxID=470 RepID=A0AAJ0VL54_ACIBA|nr:hypothetical protein LV35_04259 [Acinetobacter baumannii]